MNDFSILGAKPWDELHSNLLPIYNFYRIKREQVKMIDECRFQFGDLVFAKVKDFPFWPARIDCVRLSSYKNGVQSDEPGSSTL